MKQVKYILGAFLCFALFACEQDSAPTAEQISSYSKEINELLDKKFDEEVDRSPVWQSYLGIKKDYDKWDDSSDEAAQKELEFTKKDLEEIKAIDQSKLDEATKLSVQLYISDAEKNIKNFEWRFHNYSVDQMNGTHSWIPSFLINIHGINDVKEANDYITRIKGTKKVLAQLIENIKTREEMGIIPPKFVFPMVLDDCKNIITGKPFTESEENSTILADFTKKVNALEIEDSEKEALISEASTALVENLKPGYMNLVDCLIALETKATTDHGVWKFPNGADYFNVALEKTTTTKLTAEEIHQIGLDEVARIHGEMRDIMKQVEFEGSMQAFFEFMRTDKQFYYEATPEGKKAYMDEAENIINTMKGKLDDLFLTKPKADLIVKSVEPFREKSAGKAFYQSPAPDGSRPGTYYANTYNMGDMPNYQMEALAYHEGIPGHHMQLSIAQEMETLPKFRRFGSSYTAYVEGWGLYSEFIPKEIGFYQNPYSDFGRLAMELWRACRLVVDTGIHSKKWTRKEGIEYYKSNTPNAENDCVKMVERHIVMAGQATAYKIGMLKILELRENAKEKMGEQFDIREFHDVILKNGALPLDILENQVQLYIDSKKA